VNLEAAINEVHPESAAALAAKMAKLQQELIDRTERRENYDDYLEFHFKSGVTVSVEK